MALSNQQTQQQGSNGQSAPAQNTFGTMAQNQADALRALLDQAAPPVPRQAPAPSQELSQLTAQLNQLTQLVTGLAQGMATMQQQQAFGAFRQTATPDKYPNLTKLGDFSMVDGVIAQAKAQGIDISYDEAATKVEGWLKGTVEKLAGPAQSAAAQPQTPDPKATSPQASTPAPAAEVAEDDEPEGLPGSANSILGRSAADLLDEAQLEKAQMAAFEAATRGQR